MKPIILLDAEATPASGATAPGESSTPAPAAPAASATAPEGDKPIADIVKEIAAKHSAKPAEPDAPPAKGQENEPTAEGDKEEPTPEPKVPKEEKKEEQPPFHEHPRWKEMVEERNKHKADNEKLTAELGGYKPKALVVDNLNAYCEQHRISEKDLQEALEITALGRSNPGECLKRLQAIMDNLGVQSGSKLPADLQKKVDDGRLDLEDAQELAKSRLGRESAEATSRQSQASAAKMLENHMSEAIGRWEESTKKTDPSFEGRREMLVERIHFLWSQNPPTSVQAAVALVDKANAEIKERFSKFTPKPQARKILTTNGSSINGGAALELNDLNTDTLALVKSIASKHR